MQQKETVLEGAELSPNSGGTDFIWTKQTEQAALLVAEGKLPEVKIAARVKVDRTTLWRWKKQPEFAERVRTLVTDFRAAIRQEGIAALENRVQRLNADWNAMQKLRDARAKDARDTRAANEKAMSPAVIAAYTERASQWGASPKHIEDQLKELRDRLPTVAPGMETGLIVRSYKVAGGQMVEEFSFDAALLKELRAHEEQAAKELGQWTEKSKVEHDFTDLTDAELIARAKSALLGDGTARPDARSARSDTEGLPAAA